MNKLNALKASGQQRMKEAETRTERPALNTVNADNVSNADKTRKEPKAVILKKTIRCEETLLKKLDAATLALTIHRQQKLKIMDVETEMVALFVQAVEKEIGKSL